MRRSSRHDQVLIGQATALDVSSPENRDFNRLPQTVSDGLRYGMRVAVNRLVNNQGTPYVTAIHD